MAKLTKIRYHGTIPERQHDAFLLALLIAVSLNIAVFALQALIPRLTQLLQMLGPEQSVRLPEEEEAYPFVLVDPSLLDEEPDPDQLTEAEANVARKARQLEERPDLPDGFATIEEGVDDILSAPEGNPGPAISYQQSPDSTLEDAGSDNQDVMSENQEQSDTEPDQTEPEEATEQQEAREEAQPSPPQQEAPEIATESPPDPQPPPIEQIETIPEPNEPAPPPAEPAEEESEPEDAAEDTTVDDSADRMEDHPEPVENTEPEPVSEMIDLAALPITSEGFFDPETQRLEEILRRTEPIPPPPSERRDTREPIEQQPRQPSQPQQPSETAQQQRARPQPTFKKIGGASAAGGAPRRRNTSSAVRLIDSDASMALLAHRYGPYMEKLAKQLQGSLYRVMVLSPTGYSRGQVKIRFGISPDGQLTYYETVFPSDGSLESERLLGEQMLREAAPFDPLTPEMARDENFQKMTVVVHLY